MDPDDPISRASHLMRETHVGAVIVQRDGRPLGIVTDRDIVVRCGGRREALASIPVREVMSRTVATISPDDDVLTALERMRKAGVRRLAVVNEGGYLAGVLSLDDLVVHLTRTMKLLGEILAAELSREANEDEEGARPRTPDHPSASREASVARPASANAGGKPAEASIASAASANAGGEPAEASIASAASANAGGKPAEASEPT